MILFVIFDITRFVKAMLPDTNGSCIIWVTLSSLAMLCLKFSLCRYWIKIILIDMYQIYCTVYKVHFLKYLIYFFIIILFLFDKVFQSKCRGLGNYHFLPLLCLFSLPPCWNVLLIFFCILIVLYICPNIFNMPPIIIQHNNIKYKIIASKIDSNYLFIFYPIFGLNLFYCKFL